MCTLLTVDRSLWGAATQTRILQDSLSNSDGANALLVKDGQVIASFSALDVTLLTPTIDMLARAGAWDRLFLHQRMATQGSVNVGNIHGWADRVTGSIHIMHNGFLRHDDTRFFAVDSQAILHWIEQDGIEEALTRLQGEYAANVFVIDQDRPSFYVSRSRYNTLYTDGRGNYSTNSFGSIKQPVPPDTRREHLLDGDAALLDEHSWRSDNMLVTRVPGERGPTADEVSVLLAMMQDGSADPDAVWAAFQEGMIDDAALNSYCELLESMDECPEVGASRRSFG